MINWTIQQGQLTLQRCPELAAFDLLFLITLNPNVEQLPALLRDKKKIDTPIIVLNSAVASLAGDLIKVTGTSEIWGVKDAAVVFTYEKATGIARQIDISKNVNGFGGDLNIGGVTLQGWQKHLKVIVPEGGGARSGLITHRYTGTLAIRGISIPFCIDNPSGGDNYFISFGIENNENRKTTDAPSVQLDHLKPLIGDDTDTSYSWDLFPDKIKKSIADGVDIADFRLHVLNHSLASLEATFQLPVNWPIVPGLISVTELIIRLEIDSPLEPDHRFFKFLVGGTLQIGENTGIANGQIDLTARWPDLQIQGKLREGQNIEVGHILQNLGVSVPAAFEKLAIDQLSFSAEPTSEPKTFAFYINVKDALDLGKFKIESLSLSVDYTGAQTGQQNLPARLDSRFQGRFQLFGIEFYVSTQRVSAGTDGAWIFEGSADGSGTNLEKLVGEFTDASNVPTWLKGLNIKWIDLQYNTHTKDFSFQCDVDAKGLLGEGSDVELIVDVALRCKNPDAAPGVATTYEKTLSGRLLFTLDDGAQLEFDLLFDQASTGTTFIAAYKNLVGGDINIGALTQKIGGPNIPLTIHLKDAFFIYDKTTGAQTADLLFGLDIGSGINLSNLPLVGKLFPANQTLKIGLQPLVASGASTPYFKRVELARLQGLIPAGGVFLPETDINAQVSLAINLQAGDTVTRIDLPIVLHKSAQPLSAGQAPPPTKPIGQALTHRSDPQAIPNSALPAVSGASAPVRSADGVQWFDLQQSFGPVQFNRIGFAYSNSQIHAYLDAAMGLAGLTLTLDGLSMRTPLDKISPAFSLNGLGLDYRQGPVEIGGSFLRALVPEDKTKNIPAYDAYDGMATLKMETFNISAIGSYAKVNGQDSLFIYAVLNYPIGGPSFFFVTGLAAGFGYNRAFRMPDITGVAQFPLINQAVNGAGSGPSGDDNARRTYLQDQLGSLRSAIYPAPENFLAAGVRFSSFKMIDSFVLVSVSFGQHFEVDVLGLSTLVVPTPEPGQKVTPVAEVQLALKATFNPDEGVLSVEALLTNNSYLFSRACHLTGGFAFYSWFKGEHSGDFVITLGGYHPKYLVPAHYPTVPRLGFNWTLSDVLSIKGEAYFALTAHALMAGGKLEALFHKGDLKAWFVVGADFIISWKPYFYDARMYLDIGASYTFDLFGTHTISVSAGADLHIWGPDFSGIAKVHLSIISFTVKFGGASPKPKPINWDTFYTSFLPDPGKIVTVTVAGGLVKEEGKRAVLNPKGMALMVNSLAPVKTFELGLKKGPAATNKDQIYYADPGFRVILPISDAAQALNTMGTADFGIAPMDVAKVSASALKIEIKRDGTDPANTDFAFTPVLKRMPRAMWGDQLTAETNGAQFIENALAGFEIRPAKPALPGETQLVLKKELQYDVDQQKDAFACPAVKSYGRSGQSSPDLSKMAAVAGKRNGLLQSLGLDLLDMDVPVFDDRYFVETPMAAAFASS